MRKESDSPEVCNNMQWFAFLKRLVGCSFENFKVTNVWMIWFVQFVSMIGNSTNWPPTAQLDCSATVPD